MKVIGRAEGDEKILLVQTRVEGKTTFIKILNLYEKTVSPEQDINKALRFMPSEPFEMPAEELLDTLEANGMRIEDLTGNK